MSLVTIIPIGGKATRWNNYLDTPKYKVLVDGIPILDRTLNQISKHDTKPIIITDSKTRYGDIDKIYSSNRKWNHDGKTIIMFGDTFFTDNAIDLIFNNDSTKFMVYGRVMGSTYTGKQYGELFAVSFWPEHIPAIITCIERVARLYERGIINNSNLWALYRAIHHFPDDLMGQHFAGEDLVQIDDFTEDFDWPHDYDRFIQRWNEGKVS